MTGWFALDSVVWRRGRKGTLDLERRQEIGRPHAEGSRQPANVHERYVALAPLDPAQVAPREATVVSEGLLREACCTPSLSKPKPEGWPGVG